MLELRLCILDKNIDLCEWSIAFFADEWGVSSRRFRFVAFSVFVSFVCFFLLIVHLFILPVWFKELLVGSFHEFRRFLKLFFFGFFLLRV